MKSTANVNQQLALTWDQAYNEGFRCGEMRDFALGYDAGTKELHE